MARPAPPGRRRAPASRNVSSTSVLSQSGRDSSSSPSPPIAAAALDQSFSISDNSAQVHALRLYADNSIESLVSGIPLEEVEKALTGLSREDLVLALKRAKEQMDIVRNSPKRGRKTLLTFVIDIARLQDGRLH